MPSKQKKKRQQQQQPKNKNKKRPLVHLFQEEHQYEEDEEEEEREDGGIPTTTNTSSSGILTNNINGRNEDDDNNNNNNNSNSSAGSPPPPLPNNQNHDHYHYPYRKSLENLYTTKATLDCALGNNCNKQQQPCIACAYKICTFDIALDTKFTNRVPNIRPELCPRSSSSSSSSNTTTTTTTTTHGSYYYYGYQPGMRILTVGDGDFTFSLALARMLSTSSATSTASSSSAAGDESAPTTTLIATSYESLETLQRVYGSTKIQETIKEMKQLMGAKNCQVYYQVDATNLQDTLPHSCTYSSCCSSERQTITTPKSFHRIVWNFPCTAISQGQDGQNQQMEQNKLLIRSFVSSRQKSAMKFLDANSSGSGEIHFLHKTKPPYDQWKLEDLVVNGVVDDDDSDSSECVVDDDDDAHTLLLEYKGRIVFDKCLIPPYTPRKALDKKSFPCHDACLYVFGHHIGNGGHGADGDVPSNNTNKTIKKTKKKRQQTQEEQDSTTTTTTTTTKEEEEISSNDSSSSNSGRNFLATIPSSSGGGGRSGVSSSSSIIPVTRKLIDQIRNLHLQYGSYNDRKQQQNHGRGQKQKHKGQQQNSNSYSYSNNNNNNKNKKKRRKW